MTEPVTLPMPGSYQDGFTFLGGDPASPASWVKSPKPGTVEDGHRFKGGDPASPDSWQPVTLGSRVMDSVKGAARDVALTGGLAPLAMAGRAVGIPMADWMATRGTNSMEQLGGVGDGLAKAIPVLQPGMAARDAIMGAFPATKPFLSPTAKGVRDAIGVETTNTPGAYGPAFDMGVEAAIAAPIFPGAGLNVIPGFAGGAGSELAGDATKGTKWEPYARIAGGLVGGLTGAGAQALAGRGVETIKSIAKPLTKEGQKDVAGAVLNAAATDPAKSIARLAMPDESVPGARPLAAQVANDPGLLAVQNVVGGAPGRSGELALQLSGNNTARAAALESVQPTGAAANARDFYSRQIADRRAALDTVADGVRGQAATSERAALDALQKHIDALPPGVTAEEAGRQIQSTLNMQVDVLKGVRSRAAEPFYTAARAGDAPINTAPVVEFLNQQIGNAKGGTRTALQSAASLFDDNARTIGGLDAAEKEIGKMIDRANRPGGGAAVDKHLVGLLSEARQKLLTAFEADPNHAIGRQVHAELSRPLDPYKVDRIAGIVERDQYKPTTPVMAPDMVAGKIFKPGAEGGVAIREYLATKPTPESVAALRNDIARRAREAYETKGADGLNNILMRHKPALDAFDPAFAADVRRVATSRQALDATRDSGARRVADTEKAIAAAGREVDASAPARFAKVDPESGIRGALEAADARTRIAALAREAARDKTGAATEGLRRGIVEDLKRAVSTTAQDFEGGVQQGNAGMQRWIAANREAIGEAMTPHQMKALDVLAKDFGRDARTAPRMIGSDTERNIRSGNIVTATIMENILGRKFGTIATNNPATAPLRWLYKLPEQQIRDIMLDALKDPKVTRDLMMRSSAGNLRLAEPTFRELAARNGLLPATRERKDQ